MARTQTATTTAPAGRLLKPAPRAHQYQSIPQSFASSAGATLSVDRIPAIPGFRTSAAFLSSLGANLRISDDDLLPSPSSTPPSLRASTELNSILPPPSPLARAIMTTDDIAPADAGTIRAEGEDPSSDGVPADPLAGVPELSTYVAQTTDDKVAGLKLVADSIAQQRQTASRILISHPVSVLLFGAVLAAVAQAMYRSPADLPLIFTTYGGVIMAALVTVRWLTRGYIFRAEELGWDWLGDGDGDTMIVTRYGDQIVGCCVLAWEPGEKGTRRKKSGRGVIRAWTVKLRYRRKGLGRALLEEAVDTVSMRGGDGIVFADEHANSTRVLTPNFFNAAFDKRETQARAMLEDVVAERTSWKKR